MNVCGTPGRACCPFADRVVSLQDGRLPPAEVDHVEAHLADCPLCGDLIDALDAPSDAITQALATLPSSEDDEPEFQRLERLLLSNLSDQTVPVGVGRRLADPPIGPLPQPLGNYELLSCIGRGAWGAVFRARHRTLDQTLAVKVLDSSRWESGAFLERFLQEAKAAGQLNHPNIVRATDAGEDRGFHYLVMEYIHGMDAAKLLRQTGRLAIGDACEIVRQAAAALDFAHHRGWVHRDVKPSNLLITPDGAVKLLDLGIAGRRDEGQSDRPPAHAPLGTAEYMAPEQWSNFAAVDARADVYSLGCTLFKLLAGHAPHEGTPPSITHALDLTLPSLAEYRSDVRRGLDRLVQRMLAREPRERIATAAEVAQALGRYARRADLRGLIRASCRTDLTAEVAANSHDTTEASRPGRVSRRRLVLGGTVAAAGAALVAPWLLSGRPPQLQRFHWRSLTPKSPEILLAVERPDQIHAKLDDPARISVESQDVVLVHLGRAVAGVLALKVTLRRDQPFHGAGLFFQYRRVDAFPIVCEFQCLQVRPADDVSAPATGRLLWSHCAVAVEGEALAIHRDAWAETTVDLAEGDAGQQLELVLGQNGFPEVRWNGRTLKMAAWTLSSEGHKQASLPPDRLRRHYLGRLGLFHAGGATTFLHPQLAYL